jgi:hypothetical protein
MHRPRQHAGVKARTVRKNCGQNSLRGSGALCIFSSSPGHRRGLSVKRTYLRLITSESGSVLHCRSKYQCAARKRYEYPKRHLRLRDADNLQHFESIWPSYTNEGGRFGTQIRSKDIETRGLRGTTGRVTAEGHL